MSRRECFSCMNCFYLNDEVHTCRKRGLRTWQTKTREIWYADCYFWTFPWILFSKFVVLQTTKNGIPGKTGYFSLNKGQCILPVWTFTLKIWKILRKNTFSLYKKLNRPTTSVWFRWVNIVQSFVFSVTMRVTLKPKIHEPQKIKQILPCLSYKPDGCTSEVRRSFQLSPLGSAISFKTSS